MVGARAEGLAQVVSGAAPPNPNPNPSPNPNQVVSGAAPLGPEVSSK
jgi:hypothetical protein